MDTITELTPSDIDKLDFDHKKNDLNLSQLKQLILRNQRFLDEKQLNNKSNWHSSPNSTDSIESSLSESLVTTLESHHERQKRKQPPTTISSDSNNLFTMRHDSKHENVKEMGKIHNKKNRNRLMNIPIVEDFTRNNVEEIARKRSNRKVSPIRKCRNSKCDWDPDSTITTSIASTSSIEGKYHNGIKKSYQYMQEGIACNSQQVRKRKLASYTSLPHFPNYGPPFVSSSNVIIGRKRSASADSRQVATNSDHFSTKNGLLKEIDTRLQYLDKLRSRESVKRPWSAIHLHQRQNSINITDVLDKKSKAKMKEKISSVSNLELANQVRCLTQCVSLLQERLDDEREMWSQAKKLYESNVTRLLDHIERLEENMSEMQKDHDQMFSQVRRFQEQIQRVDAIDELLVERNEGNSIQFASLEKRFIGNEGKLEKLESLLGQADERSKHNEYLFLRQNKEVNSLKEQFQDISKKFNGLAGTQNLMKEQLRLIMLSKNINPSFHQEEYNTKNVMGKKFSRTILEEKQKEACHEERYEKLRTAYNRIFGGNDDSKFQI